jgi:hypothetical protein
MAGNVNLTYHIVWVWQLLGAGLAGRLAPFSPPLPKSRELHGAERPAKLRLWRPDKAKKGATQRYQARGGVAERGGQPERETACIMHMPSPVLHMAKSSSCGGGSITASNQMLYPKVDWVGFCGGPYD